MSETRPPELWCGTCLAPLKYGDQVCSRCGWSVRALATSPFRKAGMANPFLDDDKPEIDRGTLASFSLGTLMLSITVFGVLLGITVAAPGLGIPLALLAVPPAIRTVMVVKKRKFAGQATSGPEKTALFLVSALVTWVIVISLVSACCLTFCGVCVGGYTLSGGNIDEGMAMLFAGSCTAVVAILILWAFSYWIRVRWWRDTRKNR
jgi:hypothetical protein